jgi:hypothetical protein
MALTRPKIWDIDTNITQFSDPMTVLHQGSTLANVDVGFLFNRANGLVSNVALYWNESGNSFVTAFTTNSGGTDTNVSVTSYANITSGGHTITPAVPLNSTSNVTGALVVNGGVGITGDTYTSGNITANTTGSIAATWVTANAAGYTLTQGINAGLGSLGIGWGTSASPGAFMAMSASGGKNFINTANRDFYIVDNSNRQWFYLTQATGNVVLNSTTVSTSTTTGAFTVAGGVGISGNVNVGANVNVSGNVTSGYHYITPTSVADFNNGVFNAAIVVPNNNWGIYSNIGQSGTAYLRQVIGRDSSNNIVIGHTGTGLNSNINIYPGSSGYLNAISTVGNPYSTFTVNTTGNTVAVNGAFNVVGNAYVSNRVGFTYANNVSSVYQVYNSATNSIDTIFG